MKEGKDKPLPGGKRHRHLPAFILLFLARDDELYGAAINERLKSIWAQNWCFDPGAVYRTLRELEAEGAVRSYWETSDSSRPKHIYHLTETGRQQLARWREDIAARLKNLQYFLAEYDRLPRENRNDP